MSESIRTWCLQLADAPTVERAGVAGLYLFAFFAWLGPAGAYIGTGLMLLMAVVQGPRLWPALRREPLGWVCVVSAILIATSTFLAVHERPDEASAHLDAGADILKLWAFLLVAWWLRGNQRRVLAVLAVALVGFLLGRLRGFDAAAWEAVLGWNRYGFGLPILAFGQYSAAALLGLTLLGPRLAQTLRQSSELWRWPLAGGLVILFILLLQGVLISQSRGVWLALLTTTVMLIFARKPPAGAAGVRGLKVPAKVALGALITLVIVVNSPVISQRFAFGGGEFFDNLLAGRFESIDDLAVKDRLVMLQMGLGWFLDHPWLGWGPGATQSLFDRAVAANPGLLVGEIYNDLHNIGLDMLVRIGVFGSASLLVGVVLIFYRLRQTCIRGLLDRDLYLVLLALLTLHFLCALTNFRVLNGDWRFYWMLIAGAASTFHINQLPGLPGVGVGSSLKKLCRSVK